MSKTGSFKCPGCGAWLEWNASAGKMQCPYCSTEIRPQDMKDLPADEPAGDTAPELEKDSSAGDAYSPLRAYHCQMCGSEVTVGDTTAATRCYYCHSPVVFNDKLAAGFKPDAVLPFKLDRDAALKQFNDYLNRKKFVDRRFLSPEQLENLSGVYYPYWYGSVSGSASMTGSAENVTSVPTPRETIVTTRRYKLDRKGRITFRNMVRKALKSNDRTLTDGIFDYDMNEIVPYRPEYLSGFMAERRDIEKAVVEKDMQEEAARSADAVMREGLAYNSVHTKTDWQETGSSLKYVLLPTWVLTYRGGEPGTTFFYMLNGQTGSACGKLPVDKKKLLTTALIYGVIVAALMLAGGKFIW